MLEVSDFVPTANYDAVCLTIVEGVSPESAVAAISKGKATKAENFDEASEWVMNGGAWNTRVFIAAGEVSGRTFVWEDNGFAATYTEVAQTLSARGRSVTVY